MTDKLMTIQDLVTFYITHFSQSTHFSSKENNTALRVQMPGVACFSKEDKENDDKRGLLTVKIKSAHIGKNLNGSSISKEAMEAAIPSFYNRPILGYIHEVDGAPQFYGHNMHKDGDEFVYDEIPIGHIPESATITLEKDEQNQKTYCVVNDAYIYEDYTKAAEIIKRNSECSVSVELEISELTYDSDTKEISLDEFIFRGVTILGMDENGVDIAPGMEGAALTLSDSERPNDGGGEDMANKTVNKLSACTFEKTDEFEPKKLAEAKDNKDEEIEDEDPEEPETGNDDTAPVDREPEDDEDKDEEKNKKSKNSLTVTCSVSDKNGIRKFEKSLNDKICELSKLIDITYGYPDETWYDTAVYETYVVMTDYKHGKIYRQEYAEEEGDYKLVGERVEVSAIYVTPEEEEALKVLRAENTELKTYRAENENKKLHETRMSVIQDEKYAAIFSTQAYKDLLARVDDYTVEDLSKELKCIFADYALVNGATPVADKNTQKVIFGRSKQPKESKYGGLFQHDR